MTGGSLQIDAINLEQSAVGTQCNRAGDWCLVAAGRYSLRSKLTIHGSRSSLEISIGKTDVDVPRCAAGQWHGSVRKRRQWSGHIEVAEVRGHMRCILLSQTNRCVSTRSA